MLIRSYAESLSLRVKYHASTSRPRGLRGLQAENDKLRRELNASRRELGETQDRLRLAHEAGRAGTFDWFIPQNKIVWSSELEALYGMPVGAFEGAIEHWVKQVHPEDAARILPEIEEMLSQRGTDYNYEFRAMLPDDSARWLRGQARFFYSETGEPLRMDGWYQSAINQQTLRFYKQATNPV